MLRDDRALSLNVLEVLEVLLAGFRHRPNSRRFTEYHPLPQDRLRELACYSANLVTLRAVLEPGEERIALTRLLRAPDDALEQWRSTVQLWKAGLDADGLQSVLATVERSGAPPGVAVNRGAAVREITRDDDSRQQAGITDIDLARLAGDRAMEVRLKYGLAITGDYLYSYSIDGPGRWLHDMASWLIPAVAGRDTSAFLDTPPEDTPDQDVRIIADLIFSYLRTGRRSNRNWDISILKLLFELPRVFEPDHEILAAVAISDAVLPERVPELKNPGTYGRYAVYLEGLFPAEGHEALSAEEVARGREALEGLFRRRTPWDWDDSQRPRETS